MSVLRNAIRTVVVASSLAASTVTTLGAQARYTRDDVRFMQDMIAHHAQALTMAALITNRTASPELQQLGERITVSRRDEIAAMRRWLLLRHEDAPNPAEAQRHDGITGMQLPGMLSPSGMLDLENATGTVFDRLFLADMIKHHDGAIAMIRELFHSPGGGQESELSRFAASLESGERAEITRMRALLDKLSPRP